MQQENEYGVRLNEYGEPDVDYYVARAHTIRSQAIATAFRAFKAWLIKALDRSWFPDQGHRAPAQRVIQSDWPWVDLILQGAPDRKTHQA